ncbi:MAG: extracellular solute-binding protein [Puniceicoccales bacterium]|jgi:ABC-type Fe3+ transport system substrate-binding protein|nr:extracellular solute-binding protein [Puniceicoccales bacterium]
MAKKWLFTLCGLLIICGLPFVVREKGSSIYPQSDDRVVVLVAHNENIRYEVGRGFSEWYKKKTGRTVFIDWRYLGGVSEIIRYLDGVYTSAFRYYWENELNRQWTSETAQIFANRSADPSGWKTPAERDVCSIFYNSNVSSGIDIFFGGGVGEFERVANQGLLADTEFGAEHPELIREDVIPQHFAGSDLCDAKGRWYGSALCTFGIIYNSDALAAKGLNMADISQWEQLADPQLIGMIALADPTKSSALLKALEMVVQQQIMFTTKEQSDPNGNAQAIRAGWLRGLRIIQRISANTRYFADTPTKMILDVGTGNSAVGIIVDFMGKAQSAAENARCGYERLGFVIPQDGSATSSDPIGILRGAPNVAVAKKFLEYVLSEDGQKIFAFNAGAPGGPVMHTLHRPPINKRIYSPGFAAHRTGNDNPYISLAGFDFHPERTAPVYNALKWMVKFAFIIPHQELISAWRAIVAARAEGRIEDATAAQEIFDDFSDFEYDAINGTLTAVLSTADPAAALAAQREIVRRFQIQYSTAKRRAMGQLE